MSKIAMPIVDIVVPAHYFKMNAAPDDPPYATPYGSESNGYQAFVLVYPVHVSKALPFGHPETLVNGIHDNSNAAIPNEDVGFLFCGITNTS